MVKDRKKGFYWSSSKVNAANYCNMRYFLRYLLGYQEERISPYVKGSHWHNLIEHIRDRFGEQHEIKRNKKGTIISKKKYYDAEGFVDYAQGTWQSILKADETAEEKIAWKYDGEGYVMKSQFKSIGIPLFESLMAEDEPIFIELPFDFKIGKERFKGRIDEVRVTDGTIVVRDYKSGRPWIEYMKLKHDPQLTLYNVGLCTLIRSDPHVRRKIEEKLDKEILMDDFMAGNGFVSPNMEMQFFMIEALGLDPDKVKTVPEPVNRSGRKDEHFFEVLNMVQGVRTSVNIGNVYPERGKKCDSCSMKYICDKELEKTAAPIYIDKNNQSLLNFAAPLNTEKPEPDLTKMKKQQKIRFQYRRGGIPCVGSMKKKTNLAKLSKLPT